MVYENERVEKLFQELQSKSEKAIDYMKGEFNLLRAGRANPKILDKISVDYYGAMTPLNQMGNIAIGDPRTLVVSLWDKSAISKVEKAILAANIGLNPQNDGNVIRLVFPEVTEERRKELVKSVKKLSEETKVVVRNHRRDAMEALKKMKAEKSISEDAADLYEKEVDKVIAKQIELVEKLTKEKETDVMAV